MVQENGQVKWFNNDKGYGFITVDGRAKDIFVHYTKIKQEGEGRRNLATGQNVTLEVEETVKGLAAVNVEPIQTP